MNRSFLTMRGRPLSIMHPIIHTFKKGRVNAAKQETRVQYAISKSKTDAVTINGSRGRYWFSFGGVEIQSELCHDDKCRRCYHLFSKEKHHQWFLVKQHVFVRLTGFIRVTGSGWLFEIYRRRKTFCCRSCRSLSDTIIKMAEQRDAVD